MTTLLRATFPSTTLPVGTNKATRGYWTHYNAIDAAGVAHIQVTPSLHLFDLNKTPATHARDIYIEIHCHFDERAWPVKDFGLVYTDGAFEEAFAAWAACMHMPADFAPPSYTEAGMQGDGFISLEYRGRRARAWTDIWGSKHAALSWLSKMKAQQVRVEAPACLLLEEVA